MSNYPTTATQADEAAQEAPIAKTTDQNKSPARAHAEHVLRSAEQRYRYLFEQSKSLNFVLLCDGTILDVNESAARQLGYRKSDLVGRLFRDFVAPGQEAATAELLRRDRRDAPDAAHQEIEILATTGRRTLMFAPGHQYLIKDGQVSALLLNAIDMTEHRNAALIDSLTGLANRESLLSALKPFTATPSPAQASAHESGSALLLMGIDRFKLINEALGRDLGDELLVAVGRRIESALRNDAGFPHGSNALCARLGGDEFAVLLRGLPSPDDAAAFAARLQSRLNAPFSIGGHVIHLTVSIGIVDVTETGGAEGLLRDADTAMCHAKTDGGGRHARFEPRMLDRIKQRVTLEQDLRTAVERRDLFVVYQPIVSLADGSVEGFEALVRWRHLEKGLIPPLDFIPVAEETGLIIPIGQFVLEEACLQMRRLMERGPASHPLTISVNLSKRQLLEPDLIDRVQRVLDAAGVAPHQIKLEVTESLVMEHAEAVTPILQGLKALGLKLAMDDFGTGHSSLSCLHRFPVDDLKIDRSFIENLSASREYAAVVNAIVTLAHNLGKRVVAEGLEQAHQVVQLQALECDLGQGYFFARPLAAETLGDYLDQHRVQQGKNGGN